MTDEYFLAENFDDFGNNIVASKKHCILAKRPLIGRCEFGDKNYFTISGKKVSEEEFNAFLTEGNYWRVLTGGGEFPYEFLIYNSTHGASHDIVCSKYFNKEMICDFE